MAGWQVLAAAEAPRPRPRRGRCLPGLLFHKDVAVAARRRRVRDPDLRRALALVEQAFGPVTVLATRRTPPEQRRRSSTAASSNGHRPSAPQGAGAERDGQTCLDLTVSAAPGANGVTASSAPAAHRDSDREYGGRGSR